jgi:hypothetical protein
MSKHLYAAGAHRTIAGIYGTIFVLAAIFFAVTTHSPLLGAATALVPGAFLVGLHLLVARGAEQCKPWARVTSIVLGLLFLPGFPIGTGIGIWVLLNSLAPWVPESKYSGSSLSDGWPQARQDNA